MSLLLGTASSTGAITNTNLMLGPGLVGDTVKNDATPGSTFVTAALLNTAAGNTWDTLGPVNGLGTGPFVFDAYYPHPVANGFSGSGPGEVGFITANPLSTYPDVQGFGISQPGGGLTTAPFKDAGYFLTAGNGGNSQSGAGGAGGGFGQSLTVTTSGGVTTGTGSLSFQFPTNPDYQGTVNLLAGNGGNGFTNAGAGGAINGVSLTYASGTPVLSGVGMLTAGNGGESLTGAGGAGGSLGQLYIVTGEDFTTGSGGIGVTGGAAGSMFGNTQPGLLTGGTNSVTAYVQLSAGNGANGIDGGGAGGGIYSFVNDFLALTGGTGGLLSYTAGSGGTAVAGNGGAGGSIVNCSPSATDDNLAGDIYLQGGSGGSGLSGGIGGGVNTFTLLSTAKQIPSSSTILGGSGGNATTGTGGAGGNITSINVSASGVGSLGSNFENISYNSTIAGPGGLSTGGAGGTGGSVSSINTASVAPTAQNVVAAGAGGAGLTAGGNGGSVIAATVNAGSSSVLDSGKVVIIAGDGGTTFSGKPLDVTNVQDVVFAVGGVNGAGGNGGSITGFTQPGNVNAFVDLIAGNGGATLGHSVAFGSATTDNSGKGGSITSVSVQGSIGDSDPNVAIKSYDDPLGLYGPGGYTTMQQFVNGYILANIAGGVYAPMDNTIGNVGLVAGAAGSVESGYGPAYGLQASTDGVNGSVNNVHAENIMSMVAGNVEQVAPIESLTNYGVTIGGGILGASKLVSAIPGFTVNPATYPTVVNYITPQGQLTLTPQELDTWLSGGGALLDGAFFALSGTSIPNPRDFILT